MLNTRRNETYCLRNLGNLLWKLKVTDNMYFQVSLYFNLVQRINKIQASKKLREYEQKIKDHKANQRSRSLL